MEFKEKIYVVKLADGTIAGIFKLGPGSDSVSIHSEIIYDYRENELIEQIITC